MIEVRVACESACKAAHAMAAAVGSLMMRSTVSPAMVPESNSAYNIKMAVCLGKNAPASLVAWRWASLK